MAPTNCWGWFDPRRINGATDMTSAGCQDVVHLGRLALKPIDPGAPMIEYKPIEYHIRLSHEPARICDGQPAGDDHIATSDMEALREARAETTLCPVCQQNSNLHSFSLRPNQYRNGKRTLAHLYTIPVQYAFDDIRNCPHCRENPGDRTCRASAEARQRVRVLHREARRIARDVTGLSEAKGGCAATVYQFADGSVAYFALDAPPWREADEVVGRALDRALRVLERATGDS